MSRSIVHVALAFVSLVHLACSSSDSSPDPGSNDAGSAHTTPVATGADAASKPIEDAGPAPVSDTGSTAPDDDATTPIVDASTPIDAPSTAACTGANKICLSMSVPAGVDPSKVAKLYIGFAQSKGGIPEIGKGTTLQPFTALPGQTMPLTIDNKGLSGSYFVNVGLYMQGGGSAQPKAGVDYSATTSQAIAISSAATAIPEVLVLSLAQ